ncbi:hypothetical protein GCM10009681_09070 [Luedemannella helvata]|uniref:LigA protein n=2 Tax=Luedemannella helvata TaxID=349315 RepID=A0ABP4VZP1_9ACTN
MSEESAAADVQSDQQLSDALARGLQADVGDDTAESYGEPGVMTASNRIGEIKADRDAIIGDKINNHHTYYLSGGSREREPAPLTVRRPTLEEVRHAFVPPGGFEQVSMKQRLLILRVAGSRGGGTAAIRLLLDNQITVVKELAPDAALRRISGDKLETGAGYLLRNATRATVEELTEFEVTRLCEELANRGSRMVLTVDPALRIPAGLLEQEYTAVLADPPTAVAVLTAHLRHRLRLHQSGAQRTEEIVGHEAVVRMVAEWADRDDRAARAAAFARVLADAEQAGDFDLDRIRDRLKRVADASFEAWFDDLDYGDRCFAISLATLPGFSYEIVSDAAVDLERTLTPPVPEAQREASPDPFHTRRSKRLDAVLARVSNRPVSTRYGVTPMEVVTFIDQSLSDSILKRVWTEYPQTREALLQWLRMLARHPVAPARRGAARAVGVFAVQAFDYVRRYVILPWALSTNVLDRQAAALALMAPACDPAVSNATRLMVYEWHLDVSEAPLRNTAARAYGSFGLAVLDEALDAFAHLVAGNADHAQVVASSIASLIVQADEVSAVTILRQLRYWMTNPALDPPDGSSRARRDSTPQERANDQRFRLFAAYFAFLSVAIDVRLVNPVDDRPDATAWPGLLWLAEQHAEIADVVGGLWKTALVHPISHTNAINVLEAWAEAVDPDSRGRQALACLLASATRDDTRARTVVHQQARGWRAGHDAIAPRTGEAVLAALSDKPQRDER